MRIRSTQNSSQGLENEDLAYPEWNYVKLFTTPLSCLQRCCVADDLESRREEKVT